MIILRNVYELGKAISRSNIFSMTAYRFDFFISGLNIFYIFTVNPNQ